MGGVDPPPAFLRRSILAYASSVKREKLRSGKPPSAGLTLIVDKPHGECRLILAISALGYLTT